MHLSRLFAINLIIFIKLVHVSFSVSITLHYINGDSVNAICQLIVIIHMGVSCSNGICQLILLGRLDEMPLSLNYCSEVLI